MNIYVGNLPYSMTDDALREIFEAYGSVDRAAVISDKFTGRSKGFGFVEMSDNGEAQAAVDKLNGSNVDGRDLRVNEAQPREQRPARRPARSEDRW
ncbi:RNA-binding protein [Gammaproteobacteria bacterium]|nr:RNA-binding protein [Gammaproteobacteria bacterium]